MDEKPASAEWELLKQQGIECSERGQLAKSLEAFGQAIDLYRATGATDQLGDLHAQIGDVQLELGHIDDAVSSYRKSLGLAQDSHDALSVATAQRRIGMAYQERGDLRRAEESYKEAERLLEPLEDESERALLHLHWGALFEDLARFRKARTEYESALGVYQSRHDSSGEVTTRRRLASVLQQLGSLSDAERELHLARASLEREGNEDPPELIEVLNLLGGVLEDQGNTKEAMALFHEAYTLADSLDIEPARVECLRRMGSALAVRGELDEAVDRYQQAIDICKQLDDKRELSEIYGDLGDVLVEQGKLDEAVKVFKAAAERLDHDNPLGLALAKRRLGAVYQEKGEYKRAEEFYSEADGLLDSLDDAGERAVLYTAWGSLCQERGRVRDALARFKQALAINEGHRHVLGEAICRRHIGSALQGLGRLDESEEELRRSRALFEQQGGEDKPEIIEVTNQLGAVLVDQGRINEALDLFRQAHSQAHSLGIGPAKVECLRRMGSAFAAGGSLVEAEGRYLEAIELCRSQKDEVALSTLYGEYGDVLAEQGRLKEAIGAYKESLSLDQGHQDILGIAVANRRLGTAYQSRGDHDRARDYYDEAERLLRRLDDDGGRALLCLHRGSSYEDQGRYAKALSEYARARSKYQDQRNPLKTALACRREGSAQLQLNRVADAEASANSALEQLAGIEDKPEQVECINLLGAVRRAQGRLDEAHDLHSQALAIAENLELQPARANSLRHISAVLAGRNGDGPRLALERLEVALEICKELEDEVALSELYDDIADVNLILGQIDAAVSHYEKGLRIARRLDRYALTADILLGLARCSRQLGKLDGVRVHLDDAREMIEQIDSSPARQARLRLELAQIEEDEGKPESAIKGYEKALRAFSDCNDTLNRLECHRLLLAAYTRRRDFSQAGLHLSKGLELEGNVRALWSVMLNQLHPAVRGGAEGAFAEGRYGSGVLEALKACEQEFRSRLEDAERMKMPEVLAKSLAPSRRGGVDPWMSEDQLKAFQQLCLGAFGACRNPLAHNQLSMDASQAFSWLGVAHLMMTLMDAPNGEGVPGGAGGLPGDDGMEAQSVVDEVPGLGVD